MLVRGPPGTDKALHLVNARKGVVFSHFGSRLCVAASVTRWPARTRKSARERQGKLFGHPRRGSKLNFKIASLLTGWPYLRAGSNRQRMAAWAAVELSNFWPGLKAFTGVALTTSPAASTITLTSI